MFSGNMVYRGIIEIMIFREDIYPEPIAVSEKWSRLHNSDVPTWFVDLRARVSKGQKKLWDIRGKRAATPECGEFPRVPPRAPVVLDDKELRISKSKVSSMREVSLWQSIDRRAHESHFAGPAEPARARTCPTQSIFEVCVLFCTTHTFADLPSVCQQPFEVYVPAHRARRR